MPHLIIPVEEQVRELDAKLLIAIVAAQRGFSVVIGRRDLIEARVGRERPGVFLGMDLRAAGTFRAAAHAGHRVVAWDEEAVVHYPEPIYNQRRISAPCLAHITDLFAWGEDNLELWSRNPVIRNQARLWLTGNPRGDMLRPEFRDYYREPAEILRTRFGDFVLINTNFGSINNIDPRLNLFTTDETGRTSRGKGSSNMPLAYARGLEEHRKRLYTAFRAMIEEVAGALPDTRIVVRPHPMENWDVYRDLSEAHANVTVLHEGSVIPWLLAARAVVHNGCQTGLETRRLGGVPIAFQPIRDPDYDSDLPNLVSHRVENPAEVVAALRTALAGGAPDFPVEADTDLLDRYIASGAGPLATERIVDALVTIAKEPRELASLDSFVGRIRASRRGRFRRRQLKKSGVVQTLAHRFGDLPLEKLTARAARLCAAAGIGSEPHIEQCEPNVFKIHSRETSAGDALSPDPVKPVFARPRPDSILGRMQRSPTAPFRLSGARPKVAEAAPFLRTSFPVPLGLVNGSGESQPLAEEKRGPHGVYIVPFGFVSQSGAVCDGQGRILHGATHKYLAERIYKPWFLRAGKDQWTGAFDPIAYVDEPVCALTASNQAFYYHWMIEVVGRLVAMRLYSPDLEPQRIFVSTATRFQRETLALLDLKPERIISSAVYPMIGAATIVAPSFQVAPSQIFPKEIIDGIVEALTLRQTAKSPLPGCRRLYLSRAGASHRRVLNEEEVAKMLADRGFTAITLEDYSLPEQIALMSSAEMIVSPHGGGLTNMIFCRPGTPVLELLGEPIDLYQRLAHCAGLPYASLVGRTFNKAEIKKMPAWRFLQATAPSKYKISLDDFEMQVDEVAAAADRLLH